MFQYNNNRVNSAKKAYLLALLNGENPKESLDIFYPVYAVGSLDEKREIVAFTRLLNEVYNAPIYSKPPIPAELNLAYYKNVDSQIITRQ